MMNILQHLAHNLQCRWKVALPVLSILMALFASCSEKEETWSPYYNWAERNDQWYQEIADSAHKAIAEAKAQYGEDWEKHCEWRMFGSLLRDTDEKSPLDDSICVHIVQSGDGTFSPTYSDSVRLNFRGWTMKTEYLTDNGNKDAYMAVFTQTYYGDYNPQTAAPQTMAVSNTIEGFCTALQYMVTGDDWLIYIPQKLAYGSSATVGIPSYSTLLFRIHMVGAYENGSGIPEWK